jgi:hypothetical protein
VTEFADIAAFARQHAACGGITPNATTPVGGGYLLTLTCACGATLDRWITAEEAREPLPIAPAEDETPPDEVVPEPVAEPEARAAASPDLQAALQAALAAEEAPAPEPVAPTVAASADYDALMREALAAEPADAEPVAASAAAALPRPASPAPARADQSKAPSADLEAALRAAVAAESATAIGRPTAARPRPAMARTDIGTAVRDALEAQRALQATSAPARPGVRGFWIVVIALSSVALGLAAWIGIGGLEIPAPGAPPQTAATAVAPPAGGTGRGAVVELVQALRQLQSASTPNTGYNVYSNRVLFAKADLDRFLKTDVSADLKTQAREIVDVHVLAAAAWRARDLDRKESWESLGQEPAIDLCPSVKRVVDFADSRGEQSRNHARGLAVAGAIPLLWECAASRLAKLDEPR